MDLTDYANIALIATSVCAFIGTGIGIILQLGSMIQRMETLTKGVNGLADAVNGLDTRLDDHNDRLTKIETRLGENHHAA